MVSRAHPHAASPSSGWAIASLLALLGVAFASEYLFPGERDRSAAPPSLRSGSDDAAAPEKGDRGRGAATPSEIPARGWKDILLRVYANVSRHRVMALAAGMTYYSILAIFPAIAALALFVFVRNLESFEVPALVGMPGHVDVLTTQIYNDIQRMPPDIGYASAYSVVMICCA